MASTLFSSYAPMRTVWKEIVLVISLVLVVSYLWGWRQYKAGFELGADMMQCIDIIAVVGQEEGLASDACQRTRAKEWRYKWRV